MDGKFPPIQAEKRRLGAKNMPVENHRVQTFRLFFAETKVREQRCEPLELPIPDQTNPLLERFLQAIHGRFL